MTAISIAPFSPRRHAAESAPVATIALLGVLGVAACGRAPAPVAEPAGSALGAAPAGVVTLPAEALRTGGITVEAAATERRAGALETPAVLQLDETRTARVGAIADGVVIRADVQVGARVQRGARLASMHSRVVHDAWAGYRRAMAERRQATTQLAFVTQAEGRVLRLLEAKAASQQEADRARIDRAAAEEGLVIAQSEVTRAVEELQHLGITPDPRVTDDPRDNMPITATVGGVVLERLVTAGTAVTTGMPLFVVSDLSTLWAVAEVDEAQLPLLAVGRDAELVVAAYQDRRFQGRIVGIGDSVNPETRRVTARIAIGNADGALKPQMYGLVRLATGAAEDVVVVPAAAVQKAEQQAVVFVEQGPGRFVRRPVATGAERDGRLEIREGLRPGERLATAGTFLLKTALLEGGRPQ